jgi:diacylglycerol kinase family enzyme
MDGDFAGYVPTIFEIIPNVAPILVPKTILY